LRWNAVNVPEKENEIIIHTYIDMRERKKEGSLGCAKLLYARASICVCVYLFVSLQVLQLPILCVVVPTAQNEPTFGAYNLPCFCRAPDSLCSRRCHLLQRATHIYLKYNMDGYMYTIVSSITNNKINLYLLSQTETERTINGQHDMSVSVSMSMRMSAQYEYEYE